MCSPEATQMVLRLSDRRFFTCQADGSSPVRQMVLRLSGRWFFTCQADGSSPVRQTYIHVIACGVDVKQNNNPANKEASLAIETAYNNL
ncbi:unnamed protein product, partial [Candidula unifasciata]